MRAELSWSLCPRRKSGGRPSPGGRLAPRGRTPGSLAQRPDPRFSSLAGGSAGGQTGGGRRSPAVASPTALSNGLSLPGLLSRRLHLRLTTLTTAPHSRGRRTGGTLTGSSGSPSTAPAASRSGLGRSEAGFFPRRSALGHLTELLPNRVSCSGRHAAPLWTAQ